MTTTRTAWAIWTLLEKPINIVAGNEFLESQGRYSKSGNYLTRSLVALTEVGQNTSISRINAKYWKPSRLECGIHREAPRNANRLAQEV